MNLLVVHNKLATASFVLSGISPVRMLSNTLTFLGWQPTVEIATNPVFSCAIQNLKSFSGSKLNVSDNIHSWRGREISYVSIANLVVLIATGNE